MRLDIRRKLCTRSDRVKCVDFHSSEPWILSCLYNGYAHIYNYESQQTVKSFEVGDVPIRSGGFVCRKSWIVLGSDDMMIRVFNYNTMERVHQFEAHSDYIRCIVIHPSQSFIITSSDDMSIKMWDWDSKFSLKQTFEGHIHYVMQIAINPKDTNTFASACLDRTVKVWQLNSNHPNFTLEGHERGVNCVAYCHARDKPYLASGADDNVVKIWDYQNKSCIHVLHGHLQNVSCVFFHPEMPLIISGAEDGTIKLWHSTVYRLENTLNYGLERCWSACALPHTNVVAFGFDEGSLVVKLGREDPAVSMDKNSGKVVMAIHADIQQFNLRGVSPTEDGERLELSGNRKDMGTCEFYPHTIAYSPNGRFFAACGDGEYIVYTAMALRNKAYGNAQDFCWALEGSEFAVLEAVSVRVDQSADGLFGGRLLAVRSPLAVSFYDWETGVYIRAIEVQKATHVIWASSSDDQASTVMLALVEEHCFHILNLNLHSVKCLSAESDEVEDAFDIVEDDIGEEVISGTWVGDCFIFTSGQNKLSYYVGGEIVNIAHLDRRMYVLGYVQSDDRLYLIDKDSSVVSFHVPMSVLAYQTAVLRGEDEEVSNNILELIPVSFRTKIAEFLEKQKRPEKAIEVTQDKEHIFELALSLKRLDTAIEMADQLSSVYKYKQLAQLALSLGQIDKAKMCLEKANDLDGLFLIATSLGDLQTVLDLASRFMESRKYNMAFLCYFITSSPKKCLEVLLKCNRMAEAATFSLVYCPSEVDRVTKMWKVSLASESKERLSKAIAVPGEYKNLFPGFEISLKKEQALARLKIGPAEHFQDQLNQRNKIVLTCTDDEGDGDNLF
ncbi:hypothetical protein ACOME3_005994 [Neoechinorhynchus agilis]